MLKTHNVPRLVWRYAECGYFLKDYRVEGIYEKGFYRITQALRVVLDADNQNFKYEILLTRSKVSRSSFYDGTLFFFKLECIY